MLLITPISIIYTITFIISRILIILIVLKTLIITFIPTLTLVFEKKSKQLIILLNPLKVALSSKSLKLKEIIDLGTISLGFYKLPPLLLSFIHLSFKSSLSLPLII